MMKQILLLPLIAGLLLAACRPEVFASQTRATETPPIAPQTATLSPAATNPVASGDVSTLLPTVAATPNPQIPTGLLCTDADNELWLIDAKRQRQKLTDGYKPVVSPDRQQVLFVYEGDMM
jgi:hypothetical protein